MRKVLLILVLCTAMLSAQEKPGESRFLLRGYAHSGVEVRGDETTFVGGSFNPIFLWRQSDKLLFEAELEVEYENGETLIGLEYANMSYIINDYATLRLGKFLLPFGTFAAKLHPAWINRLSSKPLGFGHDGVGPARDLGVELRGGIPLGEAKMTYSVYMINGPALNDGTNPNVEPEEAGMLLYDLGEDNNNNKAIGGRVSFLPLSNSSMEIGFSGLYGKVGSVESKYEDVAALLYAVDFSYVSKVSFLSGVVDIKAQLNGVRVDDASYFNVEDSSNYSFSNQSSAYYVQMSYRPVNMSTDFLNSLEFVGRYSELSFPEGALWTSDQTQYAFGLNYWVDWRTVVKLSYQFADTGAHESEGEEGEASNDAIFLHWAFGF